MPEKWTFTPREIYMSKKDQYLPNSQDISISTLFVLTDKIVFAWIYFYTSLKKERDYKIPLASLQTAH